MKKYKKHGLEIQYKWLNEEENELVGYKMKNHKKFLDWLEETDQLQEIAENILIESYDSVEDIFDNEGKAL